MSTVLVDAHTLFDNSKPIDRFSPEYLRAQRAQQDATLAAARSAPPINIFSPFSNSGIADQQGGTPPGGGWTDRDVSGQANALASAVSRADVVPFRKSEPAPRSPQPRPPAQQPLRPAASATLNATDLRKLRVSDPKGFVKYLDRKIAERMAGAR
jgi:hypothetical protein